MLLDATNLSVTLGRRQVLHGASLSLLEGEVVGLIGPNGAGKSTLLRALAGLAASSGKVTAGGRDIAALPVRERARLIAHLPQTRQIGWPITVENLVALGRHPWADAPRSNAAGAICEEAMRLMDVAALRDRIATELSGGEQARVLAARAVAQDTPVLLADEPSSGLDPAHQMMMMDALRRLAGKGRAVLVSLHDLSLAARWCDRIVMLAEGRIVAEGKPDEVLTSERLSTVFGIVAHMTRDEGGLLLSPTGLVAREVSQ